MNYLFLIKNLITEPKSASGSEWGDPEAHPIGCCIQGKVYELEPESSGQSGIILACY